jgi:hypothetical protein
MWGDLIGVTVLMDAGNMRTGRREVIGVIVTV